MGYTTLGNKHPTTAYALSVIDGSIGCPIGKHEILACKRHLRDLERQGTEEFPFVFDETRANRIFDFFEKVLVHVDGVFTGEHINLLPHQKFDLGSIFGWVHKDTGYRRFSNVYKKVGRGNAKSAEMSGMSNYVMCSDYFYPPYQPELRRRGGSPQVECAAVDRQQARIVLDKAKLMAEASPAVSDRITVKRTYVEHKELGGHMRALSKDTKNKNGLNPDFVSVDEYHEHPTSFIVDVCRSAFGKKPQNLMCIITTAGIDAENNPCKQEEEALCKPILEGLITDETYFVIIREYDEGDDIHDFSLLTKANPMLQVDNAYSRKLKETIIKEHNNAYDSNLPDKIREYLTKRCNIWVEGSEDKYMTAELMEKFKKLAVSEEEFKRVIQGTKSWNGDDLSKKEDLTASGFVHDLGDGRIAISTMGFMPEAGVKRHEHTDRIPYKSFAEDGYCTITAGEVTDTEYLEKYIDNYIAENALMCNELCCDTYNALEFMNRMENKGYTPIEVRQGKYSLSEATKLFRQLIMQGKVVHNGNKLFTWCLSNAYAEQDSNENIKLSKRKATDTQRIDLVAAIINALTRYIGNAAKPSVYEERGVRSL